MSEVPGDEAESGFKFPAGKAFRRALLMRQGAVSAEGAVRIRDAKVISRLFRSAIQDAFREDRARDRRFSGP